MRAKRGQAIGSPRPIHPVTSPACSPDLTPLDYFLWGHIKGVIYDTHVESEEDLLARIMAAADLELPGTSDCVRRYCVYVYVAGRHIEPFLCDVGIPLLEHEGWGGVVNGKGEGGQQKSGKVTLVVRDWLAGVMWSRCRTRERKVVIDFVGGSDPAAPILADQQARPAYVRCGARQTHPYRSEGDCTTLSDELEEQRAAPEVTSVREICDCEHQSSGEYNCRLDYWAGCTSEECSGLPTSLLSARLGVRRTFQIKASGYKRRAWPPSRQLLNGRVSAIDDQREEKRAAKEVTRGRKVCVCEHQRSEKYDCRLDYWTVCPFTDCGVRGGVVDRLLASHLGEPGSIPGGVSPGFYYVGIKPDDADGRRAFLGIYRFPHPFIPALLHTYLASSAQTIC
ncbi:hypothetical protein PR048_015013 [Dryococelus australis]|uniref:Uncharacterized protein n=1 Tax=Dryococelus australis TaxID=614101 RepID=A0ABQ9HFS5_9NEOP|nr:hypothetical protein PR048_015013 [Dryococelus australis]